VHDTDYRAALKDFNSFLECLTQKIVEVDDTIPELPVKDVVSIPPFWDTESVKCYEALNIFRFFVSIEMFDSVKTRHHIKPHFLLHGKSTYVAEKFRQSLT
jgi:hypothetical protein